MSIPPIERALVPPKTQEASQIQHAHQQKQAHAQDQLGVQYQNNLHHDSQKTVKTVKSENNEYRYDAKEKGNGKFGNQKKGKQKKEEKENKKKKVIPVSGFDIRI